MPTNENFKQVEIEVPEPRDGEFLVRNIWMSVDPYMRGRMTERKSYVPPFELGKALDGGCIGKVVESKNNQFTVGDYVLGMNGWREYWISDGNPATWVSKIDYGPDSNIPRNIWHDRNHSICWSPNNRPTQGR